jgi:hypothetical protein
MWWNDIVWKDTCPSATLSTIYLSWTALGTNQGLYSEKPAIYRLSFVSARGIDYKKKYF